MITNTRRHIKYAFGQRVLDLLAGGLVLFGVILVVGSTWLGSARHGWLVVLWWACVAYGMCALWYHRPPRQNGWHIGIVVLVASAIGDSAAYLAGYDRDVAFMPTVLLYLAAYLSGLWMVGRQLRTWYARQHCAAALDGLTVAAGVLTLFAAVTWFPWLDTETSGDTRAALVTYAVFDSLLIVPLMWLLFSPGGRLWAIRLFVAAAALTTISHLALMVQLSHPRLSDTWLMAWVFTPILLAIAMSRASSRSLRIEFADGHVPLTPLQIVVLSMSMFVVPVAIGYNLVSGWPVPWIPIAIGGLIVAGAVSARVFVMLLLLRQRTLTVQQLSQADPMTGAANRVWWDHELAAQTHLAERDGSAGFWVGLIDIDHFERFNADHGHQVGDDLLRTAVRQWSAALGQDGSIARYDGGEFSLLIPQSAPEAAAKIIQRVRRATPSGVTCSAGLARWHPNLSANNVMSAAESALENAKRAGRDRLVVSELTSVDAIVRESANVS